MTSIFDAAFELEILYIIYLYFEADMCYWIKIKPLLVNLNEYFKMYFFAV